MQYGLEDFEAESKILLCFCEPQGAHVDSPRSKGEPSLDQWLLIRTVRRALEGSRHELDRHESCRIK